jgi:hypothetical protein
MSVPFLEMILGTVLQYFPQITVKDVKWFEITPFNEILFRQQSHKEKWGQYGGCFSTGRFVFSQKYIGESAVRKCSLSRFKIQLSEKGFGRFQRMWCRKGSTVWRQNALLTLYIFKGQTLMVHYYNHKIYKYRFRVTATLLFYSQQKLPWWRLTYFYAFCSTYCFHFY